MAFLRFSRDKRGYEYFTLVEPINRRGRSVSRVLYWFRTPPDVKVGRQPFDDSVRRALETQNPGVSFDWRAILETPIPSADAEKWRERRRTERAERAARQAAAEPTADVPAPDEGAAVPEAAGQPAPAGEGDRSPRKRRRRRGRQRSFAAQPQADPAAPVADAVEQRADDVGE